MVFEKFRCTERIKENSLTFFSFLPYKDFKTREGHKNLMFIIGRFFSSTNQDTLLLQ